jgi:hypothetical protein
LPIFGQKPSSDYLFLHFAPGITVNMFFIVAKIFFLFLCLDKLGFYWVFILSPTHAAIKK